MDKLSSSFDDECNILTIIIFKQQRLFILNEKAIEIVK